MFVALVAVNTNKAMKSRSLELKLCKVKKKESWQNHQGRKSKETTKRVSVVCAICSAFCNIALRCGSTLSSCMVLQEFCR
jgi:hypothetical protein